ncbi:MAG: anaerobic ribonucleoside-triphosphate reductase activating protein [Oscillospiraceae bacterium]|nr:anaerobic ribonucleoside-triphosphate reductase activating protein [Oscillospiraceae bacterium]
MNYHKIEKWSIANGTGIRVVLWCSGCRCYCRNCQNPQTWSFQSGQLFDDSAKQELFEAIDKTYIRGITFSGGHPLEPENLPTVTELCKEIKEKFPTKDIWLYTGYTFEDIKHLDIMKYLDVIVDGQFIEDLKDITLKWRGSINQRVIDVQKSIKYDCAIRYKDS